MRLLLALLLIIRKYSSEENDIQRSASELNTEGEHPANIYLFKISNRNSRKRCRVCSKLTIKTPERSQLRHSGVFIVNFKHILHLFLVFPLLTLKQVNVSWVMSIFNENYMGHLFNHVIYSD